MVEQRRAELEQLVKGLHRDLRVEVRVLVGTPFVEIVRTVLRDGHDLVIKDTEGRAAGTLFGSTALHLLRKCPVPVWIDRPGLPGLFIGNTAENVLNQVNCAVLAVKPEGFVSPVAAGAS